MNVFLSWSGDYSKKISKELKNELEAIFENENITVFMSEEDIHSGTKWYDVIETNLKEADCLILCLTKENIKSPWVYFEAGGVAVRSHTANVIPLLFNVTIDSKSPLTNFNNVKFDSIHYVKMLEDIRDKGNFNALSKNQFNTIVNKSFKKLCSKISRTLTNLNLHDFENNIEIYPTTIKRINKGSLFLAHQWLV